MSEHATSNQPKGVLMRTWIALATYDDRGEREDEIGDLNNLQPVVVFDASDGDCPTDAEIASALDGWTLGEEQELLLLPLDAGKHIALKTTVTTSREIIAKVGHVKAMA